MRAIERASSRSEAAVYPLFVFDRRAFAHTEWGSPKTDGHRARFLVHAVADLKARFRAIGSDLLVAVRSMVLYISIRETPWAFLFPWFFCPNCSCQPLLGAAWHS